METRQKLKTLTKRDGPRGKFVYKALLEAIREGRIKPGDRIREEDVAESLGISRTPVREALQQLQGRRLVEMAPGQGIVVVELSRRQAIELYSMRKVLEGAAARFAAQHAVPAELAIMDELLDEFVAAKSNAPRLAEINTALHRTIYEAA